MMTGGRLDTPPLSVKRRTITGRGVPLVRLLHAEGFGCSTSSTHSTWAAKGLFTILS